MNYAGFWVRFLATLIDGIIISVGTGLIISLTGGGAYAGSPSQSLFMLAAQWAYYSLME